MSTNQELIEKYPFLAPRNVWTDQIETDSDYTVLDDMPDGWRIAFGEELCARIKDALLEEGGTTLLNKYRVYQIKEKWGVLCWYGNFVTDKIYKILAHYEQLSAITCIQCGKPATKVSRGWIEPLCDECGTGDDYMGLESIMI